MFVVENTAQDGTGFTPFSRITSHWVAGLCVGNTAQDGTGFTPFSRITSHWVTGLCVLIVGATVVPAAVGAATRCWQEMCGYRFG